MDSMSATYSPEDNKLRLYAVSRLPKDLYERVRAAGFIWAPKQELFVAPMWTPAREDLMVELCGEIGDEDKSLVARQEERAERFEDYSDNRKSDADAAHKAVSRITDGIPLGQPILVGHHSEKHARKDAERIENGMRRAVKMWEQSEYWKNRAAGALRLAKYKERPDVRARRIKKLEADQRKHQRSQDEQKYGLKFWSEGFKLRSTATGEVTHYDITEANREWIHKRLGMSSRSENLNVVRKEGGSAWEGWDAWHALAPDGERYEACPSCTVEQCREKALVHYPHLIAFYQRWIDHYENRLTYERAMLAESGGTAADRTGPEVGGGARCWASKRDCWSYIVKVNKVSVTILDNFGNSGRNFTRTIEFDKLSQIISKAQVEEARAAGLLFETSDKTAFAICKERPKVLDETQIERNERAHVEYVASKAEAKAEAEKFDAMRDSLKAGVQVVTAPQLFPTPPALAARMVELADLHPGDRILEPSAGTGNILRAIADALQDNGATLTAVEINLKLAHNLAAGFPHSDIRRGDFLTFNGDLGKFDRILMNPPFKNGDDIKHIQHALNFLNPGGRLVAICASGPRQLDALQGIADNWEDLPAGTFSEQGTNVNTALVVITK